MDDPLFEADLEKPILGKIRGVMMSSERQRIVVQSLSLALDDTLKYISQHQLSLADNNAIAKATSLNAEICWVVDVLAAGPSNKSPGPGVRSRTAQLVNLAIHAHTFAEASHYISELLMHYYLELGFRSDIKHSILSFAAAKFNALAIVHVGIIDRELPCKILQERRDIQDVFETETQFLVQMKFRPNNH